MVLREVLRIETVRYGAFCQARELRVNRFNCQTLNMAGSCLPPFLALLAEPGSAQAAFGCDDDFSFLPHGHQSGLKYTTMSVIVYVYNNIIINNVQ